MSMSVLDPVASHAPRILSRLDFEDFLYHEAALLDAWRLDEWYALFTEDAVYEVPTAGSADDVSSSEALFYIADDHGRLGHRIKRLNKSSAHAEFPHSKTARIIGNVRVLDRRADATEVGCTFVVYRSKDENLHIFAGHIRYLLREDEGGALRIASKRVFLDMNSLRSQGRVSILL